MATFGDTTIVSLNVLNNISTSGNLTVSNTLSAASITVSGSISANSFTENGTALSSKYMAKSIFTAANQLLVGSGNGTYSALAKGSNGTFLGINSSGNVAWVSNPNSHYTATLVLGGSTATSNATSDTANDATYLNTVENSAKSGGIQIIGAGSTTVKAKNGVLTISSVGKTYSLEGNTTSSGGTKYVEASWNSTTNVLDLTTKYMHLNEN